MCRFPQWFSLARLFTLSIVLAYTSIIIYLYSYTQTHSYTLLRTSYSALKRLCVSGGSVHALNLLAVCFRVKYQNCGVFSLSILFFHIVCSHRCAVDTIVVIFRCVCRINVNKRERAKKKRKKTNNDDDNHEAKENNKTLFRTHREKPLRCCVNFSIYTHISVCSTVNLS